MKGSRRARYPGNALLAMLVATLMAARGASAGTGPTIQVTPSSLNLACTGSFEIVIRNAGVADPDLAISSITLHNAYSQGDYGTGFRWDTSGFTLPLTLGHGESVTIPITYSAAGQSFNSRLVLSVTSNASNNDTTQYIAYHGTLCATETPSQPAATATSTPTQTAATATATPTPTSTFNFECRREIDIAPASGPVGTVVDLQGFCYALHSGRSARLYLDDTEVGSVAGDTPGDYRSLLMIPPGTPPGPHTIRVSPGGATTYGLAVFNVRAAAGPCVGDCNGDGTIQLSELVTGVNILLERLERSACPALAPGVDRPTIADLLAAVASLLNHCGEPPDVASFSGTYSGVGGRRETIGRPGEIWPLDASVSETNGDLLLEIASLEGDFSVTGEVAADGTLSFDGSFRMFDGGTSSASGSGVAFLEGTTSWITGDLEFVPPHSDPPRTEAFRFSMRRQGSFDPSFVRGYLWPSASKISWVEAPNADGGA